MFPAHGQMGLHMQSWTAVECLLCSQLMDDVSNQSVLQDAGSPLGMRVCTYRVAMKRWCEPEQPR